MPRPDPPPGFLAFCGAMLLLTVGRAVVWLFTPGWDEPADGDPPTSSFGG